MVELILVALIFASIAFIGEKLRAKTPGQWVSPTIFAVVVFAATVAIGYFQFGVGR
jgi:hypothetical protein